MKVLGPAQNTWRVMDEMRLKRQASLRARARRTREDREGDTTVHRAAGPASWCFCRKLMIPRSQAVRRRSELGAP